MDATSRRQLLVLGVLGVVLAAVVYARLGRDTAAVVATPSNPVAGTAGQARESVQAPVADVKLELLEAGRAEAAPARRNPFRFREAEPPPQPERIVAPPRPVPFTPPVPAGPPPPPPIPLRLIGMLNAPTQAGRVAVFSDGRGNTFNGREGDIIEGRYRLLKIGADSVELAYTDGRGRQVIRLSGQ
jgi:hypothetical protein